MDDIRVIDIRLLRISLSAQQTGGWWLVRVDTDQGVWGLGETYPGPGQRQIVDELLKPKLVGENPLDVARCIAKMLHMASGADVWSGLARSAIGGIEMALWDLAGKVAGLPVYRLLGGKFRDEIRMYRTGACFPASRNGMPLDPLDRAQCLDWATEIKSQGWTAMKAAGIGHTIGLDPERAEPGHEALLTHLSALDLARVDRAMSNYREALGDNIDIAYHCHGELNLEDSLKLARCIAPYNPVWLEDPMPIYFSPAWVELTRASPVPICTGEDLYSKHEFRPFIENHGLNVAHPDVPKAGGLLETTRIAEMADTHYLSTSLHNARSAVGTMAAVHVAATIRDFGMLERPGYDHLPWYDDLIIHDGPLIQNGHMRVPDTPGLGVELNEDEVKARLCPGEDYWE